MARISEALRESAMEVLLVAFHYDGVVENPTVCAAWSLGANNDADELAYAAFRDVYNGLRRTERPMGTKECRLEAASLLRDGWSPGNPVRRLKRRAVRS